MRLRLLLLTISLFILLEACNSNEGTEDNNIKDIKLTIAQTDQSPSDLVVYLAATAIYGEWFNTNPSNSAILIFNTDSTFKYINRRSSKDTTSGKWTVKGTEYILHDLSKNNRTEIAPSKGITTSFKKEFRFNNGFIYEVNKDGTLSDSYFVQSKNYR